MEQSSLWETRWRDVQAQMTTASTAMQQRLDDSRLRCRELEVQAAEAMTKFNTAVEREEACGAKIKELEECLKNRSTMAARSESSVTPPAAVVKTKAQQARAAEVVSLQVMRCKMKLSKALECWCAVGCRAGEGSQ
jgi:hypothetical protein